MKLPPLVYALAYAGLIPFLVAPLWLTLTPDTAPAMLDRLWLSFAELIAAFMAGTFWGMAMFTVEGPEGKLGVALASLLLLLAWAASALPFKLSLIALAAVFVLLALAEVWRERVLDPLGGYFTLRVTLTIGVLISIAWRLALH